MLSDRPYMHPSGSRWSLHRDSSLIKPLIIANAVIFLLSGFGGNAGVLGLLKLHPLYIQRWELWRLGTYMFAHGGLWHILFNMWGLFIFGKSVEDRLGPTRFLQLYFTSGVVGGLVWLFFNWHAPFGPGVIGASGALFGVMMAAAMMFPNQVVVLLFPPIPMKLKTFVAVYAGIEVYMELSGGEGRVAHIAHLGGLLGAFLYMRWLLDRRGRGHPPSLGERLANVWWRVRALFAPRRARPVQGDPQPGGSGDSEALGAEVDRILDKIGRQGLDSLTPVERKALDEARDRLRRDRSR